MKENSIEETIKQLELILKVRKEQKEIIECAGGWCINCDPDIKALTESIDILKDYKRVLKENKELKNFRRNFVDVTDKELKEANDYFSRKYTFVGDELAQHINTLLKVTSNSIPIQKVKDKIKELDERIKNLEKNSYWASYTISECIGIRRSLQELLKGGK